jgi:signal transduction histidine kinase
MADRPATEAMDRGAPGGRLAQLQALHRIGMAMATTLRPGEIVRMVLSEMATLTNADSATVYLRDPQAHQLIPTASVGTPLQPGPLDLISSDDLAVEVAHTGALSQARCPCADAGSEGTASGRPAKGRGGAPRSKRTAAEPESDCRLVVPLVAGDEVLGVIDLRARRCAPFDADTEDMLGTMAAQAALVYRNAITHEELELHYRELSVLYEIQQESSSTFDYHTVLSLIVERVRRLFDARECTIRLVDGAGEHQSIRIAATTGRQFLGPERMPVAESPIDRKVLGGDMLYLEDVRTDAWFNEPEAAARLGVVSMLCAPLTARGATIGTIRLYTGERREFSVADRKMLLAVAGQAAIALENARLYRQVESKNRELSASYEELRRTQKELIRKERLAALGEMAATVAHEIRNPLTSVRGFAQRIARHAGDERLRGYTDIIMEEVDRLNKFITGVLDFARKVKPSFEKVNINHVLGDIVNLMREDLAGTEIVLLPHLDMDLRDTVVDSALVKQMLLNILQNARQALGQSGVITIRTQNAGPYVRIRVADNGVGIPRENLQKVFSPFFTTKTQGTGLGLALVHRIVDEHHGKIHVRSRPGRGTIIDIFLPVVESEDALLSLA